jgi:hypothetical protein
MHGMSVQVCGSCHSGRMTSVDSLAGRHEGSSAEQRDSPAAEGAAAAGDTAEADRSGPYSRPVCFDWGSMGCMGLLGDPQRLLQVILAVVQQLGIHAVLLTGAHPSVLSWILICSASALPQHNLFCAACRAGQWTDLHAAYLDHRRSVSGSDALRSGQLSALQGFGHHAAVMPGCRAVVHHAGAGTLVAALRAGLPSVACPLQFDQFMWVRAAFLPCLLAKETSDKHI